MVKRRYDVTNTGPGAGRECFSNRRKALAYARTLKRGNGFYPSATTIVVYAMATDAKWRAVGRRVVIWKGERPERAEGGAP